MVAAQAAENRGEEWDLTWYFRWGIYATIPTWTHLQSSLAFIWSFSRAVSRIWMQLPFYANALFWELSDNLGVKPPANSCERVAFSAGVQGKPKRCRTFKGAKEP